MEEYIFLVQILCDSATSCYVFFILVAVMRGMVKIYIVYYVLPPVVSRKLDIKKFGFEFNLVKKYF